MNENTKALYKVHTRILKKKKKIQFKLMEMQLFKSSYSHTFYLICVEFDILKPRMSLYWNQLTDWTKQKQKTKWTAKRKKKKYLCTNDIYEFYKLQIYWLVWSTHSIRFIYHITSELNWLKKKKKQCTRKATNQSNTNRE